jgi:predicted nucleic acid-binding protein
VVDSTAWSLLLRRQPQRLNPEEARLRAEVLRLSAAGDALLLGAVLQEVLTGLRTPAGFERIRRALQGVDQQATTRIDYERAAEMSNACRARGIQASPTDFLVCAASERLRAPILTTDTDFQRLQPILGIRLHAVP